MGDVIMAVTYPRVVDGIYRGTIEDEHAEMIMSIRKAEKIDNLKNMIYNFDTDLILQSYQEGRRIRDIVKEDDELSLEDYIGELRDYQTVGTAFMYMSPRSIIGDGVGLGKTVEIAALFNILRQKKQMTRFLMAVETSAIGQTQVELSRFTGLNGVTLPSAAKDMRKAISTYNWNEIDGIIIKHSSLRSDVLFNWIARNMRDDGKCKIFNTFILDESSVIKSDKTKIYDYTKNICDIVDRVHFMNATTFETNIMDIYYQIDMIDGNMLPKKWRIEKKFCKYGAQSYWTSSPNEHGVMAPKLNRRYKISGYKNQEEFKKSLRLCYFGRCKADIGMDIPHVYKVYEVEPSKAQLKALFKGHRYMEVLNSPSNITDAKIPFDRKSVPKLDRLCELVENDFYDEQVMVYCFHLQAQEKIKLELEKIGRKPVILNGSVGDKERLDMIEGFNSGKYDVIITNIKKSLNLHGGEVMICYSLETNPAKLEQIRGRIDRNIDDKIKTFVLLLYKDTDEYKFFTQVVKQRAKDARDLTIDAKTAVDFFIEAMEGDTGE